MRHSAGDYVYSCYATANVVVVVVVMMMMMMMMMVEMFVITKCVCMCIHIYIYIIQHIMISSDWRYFLSLFMMFLIYMLILTSNGITHDIIHLCASLLTWPAIQTGGPGIMKVRCQRKEDQSSCWNLSAAKSVQQMFKGCFLLCIIHLRPLQKKQSGSISALHCVHCVQITVQTAKSSSAFLPLWNDMKIYGETSVIWELSYL